MQYVGQEADRINESTGYASLLPRRPRGPKGYSNPYLTLNNGDNIPEANQSKVESVDATNHETIQTITDGCSAYPSIARSVKSDTHDYESIYNGSNCASSEYDFHDYHSCVAANNLEAHEYFILEKQTPEYLDLEKDALIT